MRTAIAGKLGLSEANGFGLLAALGSGELGVIDPTVPGFFRNA